MDAGTDSAELLIRKGGILGENFSYYIAGAVVSRHRWPDARSTRCSLLALSRIALSVLLALGPSFLHAAALRLDTAVLRVWLAQLCNYAFITISDGARGSTDALRRRASGAERGSSGRGYPDRRRS